MPESPLPNMGLVTASVAGDDNAWGQITNDAFAAIDSHNHTPGNGAIIPTAGISINEPLSFNSLAATELDSVVFVSEGNSGNGLLALYSRNDELLFRDGLGNEVQLTSGGALNVAGSGGFAGDYASVGAEASFTDSTDTYNFKQQDGGGFRQYAKGAFGGLDIYERKAYNVAGVPANRVRLESPAALAASYTLTMPTATPGSTSLVQVSSSGTLTFSNTMSRLPYYTTAVRHSINFWGAHLTGTAGFSPPSTSGKNLVLGSGGVAYIEVPFVDGDIFANIQIVATAAAIGSITAELYEYLPFSGTTTLKASGSNTTTTATSTFTITPGSTFTATGGNKIILLVYSSSGATNNVFAIDANKRTA